MSPSYDVNTTATELTTTLAPHIYNKTILITSTSPNSLGALFAHSIAASNPGLLILTGRDASKAQATADSITKTYPNVRTRVLVLDLGSFATARAAAEEVMGWEDVPVIDVLVNNAGIMATPYELSPDGYEVQFAANHLGHFLFTNLIMDKVLAAPEPRVVNVTSLGHAISGHIRWNDLNFDNGATYDKWIAYAQSKSAHILFSVSLAEKLAKRGLQAYSVHPGFVPSNLNSHLDVTSEYITITNKMKALGLREGWLPYNPITLDQVIAFLTSVPHSTPVSKPTMKLFCSSLVLQTPTLTPSCRGRRIPLMQIICGS